MESSKKIHFYLKNSFFKSCGVWFGNRRDIVKVCWRQNSHRFYIYLQNLPQNPLLTESLLDDTKRHVTNTNQKRCTSHKRRRFFLSVWTEFLKILHGPVRFWVQRVHLEMWKFYGLQLKSKVLATAQYLGCRVQEKGCKKRWKETN